jgi:hypothetical protein
LLGLLLGCGLRRKEAAQLDVAHLHAGRITGRSLIWLARPGTFGRYPYRTGLKSAIHSWLASAGLSEGRVFRCVYRAGKTWGDGVAERVVWHVVKDRAKKAVIDRLAPHDLHRLAPACAAKPEANWTKSSSCWGTSPSRRPRGILAVSHAFEMRSTTGSALNPTVERPTARMAWAESRGSVQTDAPDYADSAIKHESHTRSSSPYGRLPTEPDIQRGRTRRTTSCRHPVGRALVLEPPEVATMMTTQPTCEVKPTRVDWTRWVSQLSRRPVFEFGRTEPQVLEGIVKVAP